jgi:ubiquinone biosynthesis protein COQ4
MQLSSTPRAEWSPELGADAGHATERDAVRLALSGTTWERAALGLRALVRLLRDPDDTVQVFMLGIAINASRFPGFLARFASSEEGVAMLSARPSIDSRTVDFARLRALPAETLGGAYARYLDDNRLDPDLFQAPPGLPPIPRFVVQRVRQTHDVWHVLTGYAPDVPGELALQGFTYGQLRMPSALLIATLGTLTRSPRSALRVLDGFRRGAAATFLPVVRFEELWDEPLDTAREKLGIRPAQV